MACLAWQAEAPPPAIAQSGVVNSASLMPPDFGGGAIARGSRFLIRGWRLGPESPVEASGSALAATLAGVSVEVRMGAARAQALPLTVSAGEIEAILPPDAPVGDAEIVVRKDDDASQPFPVRIVESSFGAYSRNRLGWGPAEARNGPAGQDAEENSPAHPAQPGHTITLRGTGLGTARPAPSITVADKPVTRIRYAGPGACCRGIDELSFDLPDDTPAGCYVPVRVQSAPGILSNAVTVAVRRGAGACEDSGAWLPRRLDGVHRAGVAGLLHADVLLAVENQQAAFRFEAGFATFVAAAPGDSWISPFYLFPPYGSCTGYNRIAHGGEILSGFTSMSVLAGTPIDAGGLLTITGGGSRRSIGASYVNPGSFGAPIGGHSPFPGAEESPLFLRPGAFAVSAAGTGTGPFRAVVAVSKPVRWTDRARITTVDRRRGVTVHWTAAHPDDAIVVAAINVDSKTGAMGICECLAPGRARHFTIPAADLTNLPPTTRGDSLPLNLLVISEYPGRAPDPFTAPGLDRGFAFFLSTSARSVEYR
jgi:uncharacterized protein (TIGR03437 family)